MKFVQLKRRTKRFIAVFVATTFAVGALGSAAATLPAQAATGSATASDDFERANGALGTAWTADRGTWSIASGKALSSASPGNNVATHRTLQLGRAYTVTADIDIVSPSPTGAEWAGIVGNVQGTTSLSYYVLRATTAGGDPKRPVAVAADGQQLDAHGPHTGYDDCPLRHAPAVELVPRRRTVPRRGAQRATGSTLATGAHTLPVADPAQVGGWAGLYPNTGNLRARTFGLTTTTPAIAPPGPRPQARRRVRLHGRQPTDPRDGSGRYYLRGNPRDPARAHRRRRPVRRLRRPGSRPDGRAPRS